MAGNPDDEYGYFKQPRYISRLKEHALFMVIYVFLSNRFDVKIINGDQIFENW